MGDSQHDALRVDFDRQLKLEFHGPTAPRLTERSERRRRGPAVCRSGRSPGEPSRRAMYDGLRPR